MIATLFYICMVAQIKSIVPEQPWPIEIVTKKVQEYLLLTKQRPINVSIEGPTHLRVYTRILMSDGMKGNQLYKVILEKGPLDEEIISFETEKSTVTTDGKGTPVSKWRSFYIDVPEGDNSYKITHWASPKDTILLRFSYESPKKWNEIHASTYNEILKAVEEEKTIPYYMLDTDNRVTVKLNGPTKLKVIVRLNYDKTLFGEQSFSLIVDDNGKESSIPLTCYKSDIIRYQNRDDLVPSNARTAYIPIESGAHTITFKLSGTLARSAGLRFYTEPQ